MTDSIFHSAISLTFPLFVQWAIGGTIIMFVAFLVTRALKKQSAAARLSVWHAAFLLMLLLPVSALLLPKVPLGLMAVIPESPSAEVVAGQDSAVSIELSPASEAEISSGAGLEESAPTELAVGIEMPDSRTIASSPLGFARRPSSFAFLFLQALSLVWLAGSCFLLLRLFVAHVRVWRLGRNATPDGVESSVPVAFSAQTKIPVTIGIVRPRIILPMEVHQWSTQRREMVLSHELAHVRHRDVMWQLVASLAKSLVWFQPLVWLGSREMVIEREQACDDVVLGSGAGSVEYASELLAIAVGLTDHRQFVCGAVSMAEEPLETRLQSILCPDILRSRPARTTTAMMWALFLTITLAVGAIRPLSPLPAQAAESVVMQQDNQQPQDDQPEEESSSEEGERTELPALIRGKVVDEEGVPIKDAKVRLICKVRPQGRGRAIVQDSFDLETNELGEYVWENLKYRSVNATYFMNARVQTSEYVRELTYFLTESLADGEFKELVLKRGVVLNGRVVAPESAGENGEPKNPHVVIFCGDKGGSSYPVACDRDGRFKAVVPREGKVIVTATADNYAIRRHRVAALQLGKNAKKVVPPGGGPAMTEQDLGDIELVQGTSVTGRVFDRDGEPVAGVVVAILEDNVIDNGNGFVSLVNSATLTDQEGRYRLPPHHGKCSVTLSVSGSERQGGSDFKMIRSKRDVPIAKPVNIRLAAKEGSIEVDLRACETITVSGIVRWQGKPMPRTEVHAHSFTGSRFSSAAQSGFTDDEGLYQLELPVACTLSSISVHARTINGVDYGAYPLKDVDDDSGAGTRFSYNFQDLNVDLDGIDFEYLEDPPEREWSLFGTIIDLIGGMP